MHSTIHVITPITTVGFRSMEDFRQCERADLTVTHGILERGPASIESEFDEALSVPDIIRLAITAEAAGADAIIIDCMADPGLAACREAVSIPVLGPCQTAIHVATMLGHRFSVISVLERVRSMLDRIVASHGLSGRYAAFGSVDIPVLELSRDIDGLGEALADVARKTVVQHGAGAVVLGCTGFLGLAEAVTKILEADGLFVPIIDAIPLTIRAADALVKTGLCHSKRMYPRPEKKEILGYSMPDIWR